MAASRMSHGTGWGDVASRLAVVAASETDAVQQLLHRGRQVLAPARRPGRPVGTAYTGPDIAAAARRSAAKAAIEDDVETAGSTEHAGPDLDIVPGHEPTCGLLSLLPVVSGEELHVHILRHVEFIRQRRDSLTDDDKRLEENLASAIFDNSEVLMSREVAAHFAAVSRQTFGRRLPQVAGGFVHCLRMQWKALLHRALHLISCEGFQGLLIGRVRKYDESPFSLRVQQTGELLARRSPRAMKSPTVTSTAKVVSSRHRVFMLLGSRQTDGDGTPARYMLLHGDGPSRLHVVEKQTAANLKKCQEHVMEDIPMSREAAAAFKLRISLPCTDRFSAMLKAEKEILTEDLEWLRSHALCAVHRVASGQTHMFSLVSSTVTGMLSSALAMQRCGTTLMLRTSLEKILQERLVIRRGRPCMEAFREEIYKVFLPEHGTNALQHRKQKLILSTYLNGNISDRSNIIHMSEDPAVDKSVILEAFKDAVIPALLPQGVAPFFNRSKWLGGERAVTWHGILATHHGLHSLLFSAWGQARGTGKRPAPRAGPACAEQGWGAVGAQLLAVQDGDVAPAAPAPPAAEADLALVPLQDATAEAAPAAEAEAAEDPDAAKKAWVQWNKKHAEKALAFAESDPECQLIAMRVCMEPFARLLRKLCQTSGSGFEKKQLLAAAQGKQRTFRVLELYYGDCLPAFLDQVTAAAHAPVQALPQRAHGEGSHVRSLMTRLLCKGLASVTQSLIVYKDAFPQTLFRVLLEPEHADSVLQMPPCMHDQLSRKILEMYSTASKLQSLEAYVVLASIAENFSVDTYEVERSFSQVRRRIKVKGVQTWAPTVSDVAAEGMVRFGHGRSQKLREFLPPEAARPRVKFRNAVQRQKKEKKSRLPGLWQTLLRVRTRGRQLTAQVWRELSDEYAAVKGAPQSSDFERLKALNTLAKLRHRHGGLSKKDAARLPRSCLSAPAASSKDSAQQRTDTAIVPAKQLDLWEMSGVKQFLQQHREQQRLLAKQEAADTQAIVQASSSLRQGNDIVASLRGESLDLSGDVLCSKDARAALVVSEFMPDTPSMTKDSAVSSVGHVPSVFLGGLL